MEVIQFYGGLELNCVKDFGYIVKVWINFVFIVKNKVVCEVSSKCN